MLDPEFPALLSRPIPPAKARRSASASAVSRNTLNSSHDWRSPPPYAPVEEDAYAGVASCKLMPTLLGSPITATSHLVGLEDSSAFATSVSKDWIQERSREELEELLQRAGAIIREREQDLRITSETCKSLSETSTLMRNRSDALAAHLSTNSNSSSPRQSVSLQMYDVDPAVSQSYSPAILSSQISHSPHPTSLACRRRRAEASADEVAALADQNAELLAKLTDLEADAARAERAGKRRLHNLEQEIQGLRSELEMTRAASARLEESMHSASNVSGLPSGLDEQLIRMWKKLEREAKVRELKARIHPRNRESLGASAEIRDFAPSSSSSPRRTRVRLNSMNNFRTSYGDAFQVGADDNDADGTSVSSDLLDDEDALVGDAREQAIVSLLLLKVRELEEINTSLSAEQAATRLRLGRVQEDADEARRLYDLFSDDFELEMEVVGDSADIPEIDVKPYQEVRAAASAPGTPSRKTRVRLRPCNRKLSICLAEHSSVEDVAVSSNVGRFNSMDSLAQENVMDQSQQSPSLKGEFQLSSRIEDHPRQDRPLEPQEERCISSPTSKRGSRISCRHGPGFSLPPVFSAFDEVEESSGSGHSQADVAITPIQAESEFARNSAYENHDEMWIGGDRSARSLQCELGNALGSQTLLAPQHTRTHSIAELLDGGSPDGELANETVEDQFLALDDRIRYPKPRRSLGNMALAARAQRIKDSVEVDEPCLPGALNSPPMETVALPPTDSSERPHKFTAPIIEIWLWLQFAVVIVVFVFTMARMGPKSVLRQSAVSKG